MQCVFFSSCPFSFFRDGAPAVCEVIAASTESHQFPRDLTFVSLDARGGQEPTLLSKQTPLASTPPFLQLTVTAADACSVRDKWWNGRPDLRSSKQVGYLAAFLYLLQRIRDFRV